MGLVLNFARETLGFNALMHKLGNDDFVPTMPSETSSSNLDSIHPAHVPRFWQQAVAIECAVAGDAFNPKVAVDAKGNAIAVWEQYDGTRCSVWANRYVAVSVWAEAGWGEATLIDHAQAGDACHPNIVMNNNGVAMIVWEQRDSQSSGIWANRFVPGSGWGAAVLLETANSPDLLSPMATVGGQGDGMILSSLYGNDKSAVWGERILRQKKLATDCTNTSSCISETGNASSLSVAINVKGHAAVVWTQSNGQCHQVWASRFAEISGWDQPVLIEFAAPGSAYAPHVTVDDDGNTTAVWYRDEGAYTRIWANRYSAQTASWGRAEPLSVNNGNASNPRVAADGFGNAMAVWEWHDGHQSSIWTAKYTHRVGWSLDQPIEVPRPGDATDPEITIDAAGMSLAVWCRQVDKYSSVWACRCVPGMGWGRAQVIESDTQGHVFKPQIAVGAWGEAVAVWRHASSQHSSVHANVFG
jgi:hypothetical protein